MAVPLSPSFPRSIHFALSSVASLAVAFGVLGCKDDEKCTKARNAAADAWKDVSSSAAKNKVAPNIGIDELPADKKGPHVEAWGTIEKQAEMISSSFLYEKITWNTADPALAKANAAFDGYFAKDKFKSFSMQLQGGNDTYKAAAAACRD
ncbi:MAG TPA: hypothetical protein VHP33_22080 [Polyangiaceae bacterium]|nr:hypothetical protein [Polyangiaceae bacterium]